MFVRDKRGNPHLIQKQAFRKYERNCFDQLYKWRYENDFREAIEQKLNLKAIYYLPNRRGYPDLAGLIQGTCDILEKGGIITDDKNIISFNGSKIAGIDKKNPRVEIELTVIDKKGVKNE